MRLVFKRFQKQIHPRNLRLLRSEPLHDPDRSPNDEHRWRRAYIAVQSPQSRRRNGFNLDSSRFELAVRRSLGNASNSALGERVLSRSADLHHREWIFGRFRNAGRSSPRRLFPTIHQRSPQSNLPGRLWRARVHCLVATRQLRVVDGLHGTLRTSPRGFRRPSTSAHCQGVGHVLPRPRQTQRIPAWC